jgi:hypothetical protein
MGQAVARVPPHRERDHLLREPEPGERRPRRAGNQDTAAR